MSISRRKKIRPAGTTLQAKDSLSIMDSNSHLVRFFDVLNELIENRPSSVTDDEPHTVDAKHLSC